METGISQSFFSFVLGLFGIILASFGVTVLLDQYATHPEVEHASVIQALQADLTDTQ